MPQLHDLHAGHDVLTTSVTLDAHWLATYRAVIGAPTASDAVAPPLALVARAMDELIKAVALPPGTVHSAQSCQSFAAVSAVDTVQMCWTVSRSTRRAGALFVNLDLDVRRAGKQVLTGKTSLIVPGERA